MPAIKTLCVFDPMISAGMTADEQAAQEIEALREIDLLDVVLIARLDGMIRVKDYDPDLLLIDYGGLSAQYGCWERAVTEVEYACKWAEDHPGKLMVIWTYFTSRLYREVEDQFKHLTNVLVRTMDRDSDEKVLAGMRAWFPDSLLPAPDYSQREPLIIPSRWNYDDEDSDAT